MENSLHLLFKPVSIHEVTFLSVHSSAQIGYSGGSPSGKGPGVSCGSIDIPFSVLRSFHAFADELCFHCLAEFRARHSEYQVKKRVLPVVLWGST